MEQGGKRIVMNGDAYVHRQPDANNDLLDVRSQQLIILPDEDVVYTDLPAEVLKGRSRMNGTGMHYNNRTRQLQVSASTDVEIAGGEGKQQRRTEIPAPTIPTRRSHDRPPDSPCPDDAPDRRRPAGRGGARASAHAADPRPSRRPASRARRRTQHADPVGHAALRRREEAERVHRQRQHDTRVDDADLRHAGNARGRQGQPVRHGHREQGQGRHHPPGTPRELRTHRRQGLRAEYDGTNSTFDLIGQAVVVRYVCGKPFDTIRGERVRYNEKSGTYEAHGGPNSAAAGGRVRSVAEPRARRTPPSPNAASSRPRRRGAKRLPATHPPPRMNPPSVQTL